MWLQQYEVLLVQKKEHPVQKNVREVDSGTKVGTRLLRFYLVLESTKLGTLTVIFLDQVIAGLAPKYPLCPPGVLVL